MKILFVGGGTAGSVSPLLALAQEFRKRVPGVEFFWLGTKTGPEQTLVEEQDIKFAAISCGKWRRYFSLQNILAPFQVIGGFFQACKILRRFKPDAVLTAGSFVAVPVIWAAWFRRIPRFVHQQDVQVGLANRLLAGIATRITVAWPDLVKEFSSKKTIAVGNPVRAEIMLGQAARAHERFKLEKDLPVLLIMGGGTGAKALNEIAAAAAPRLVEFCQVIHLTGGGDKHHETVAELGKTLTIHANRYHVFEFVTSEMPDMLAVADFVVARAGMGTISELSALGKAALLIPMPATHQEDNARFCIEQDAVEVLPQPKLTPEIFAVEIKDLINKPERRQELGERFKKLLPQGAAGKIVKLVLDVVDRRA